MARTKTKPRPKSRAKSPAKARPAAQAAKPATAARVSCSVCMKLVPKSDAVVHNSADHLLYFCSSACLAQWQDWDRRQDADDIRRAVDDGMQDLRMRRPG